jgi:hypothetical protein
MTATAPLLPDSAAVRTATHTAELACYRIEIAWRSLDDAYGPHDQRARAAGDAMWLAGTHLRRVFEVLSQGRSARSRRTTALAAATVAVAVATQLQAISVVTAVVIGCCAGATAAGIVHRAARVWHRHRLATIPATERYRPDFHYEPGCIGWFKNQVGRSHHELHAVIELTDRLRLVLPTPPFQGPFAPGTDYLCAAGRHADTANYWLATAAERLNEHLIHARSL